jgi:hypothetical protein
MDYFDAQRMMELYGMLPNSLTTFFTNDHNVLGSRYDLEDSRLHLLMERSGIY